jgi:DNA-binding response OmpR family regulator
MSTFTDAFLARILIVDDSDANVRLLEFTLRRAGYLAVSSTTEPLQVAALHRENPYDLILLDLQMPRMSGFEVLAALADVEEVERVAVLVLSADPSQRLAALQAGAADFLSKPFDLTEVLLRVRRLLEKRMRGAIAVPLVPAAAPPPYVLGV